MPDVSKQGQAKGSWRRYASRKMRAASHLLPASLDEKVILMRPQLLLAMMLGLMMVISGRARAQTACPPGMEA
jgi:hypothetical protein